MTGGRSGNGRAAGGSGPTSGDPAAPGGPTRSAGSSRPAPAVEETVRVSGPARPPGNDA